MKLEDLEAKLEEIAKQKPISQIDFKLEPKKLAKEIIKYSKEADKITAKINFSPASAEKCLLTLKEGKKAYSAEELSEILDKISEFEEKEVLSTITPLYDLYRYKQGKSFKKWLQEFEIYKGFKKTLYGQIPASTIDDSKIHSLRRSFYSILKNKKAFDDEFFKIYTDTVIHLIKNDFDKLEVLNELDKTKIKQYYTDVTFFNEMIEGFDPDFAEKYPKFLIDKRRLLEADQELVKQKLDFVLKQQSLRADCESKLSRIVWRSNMSPSTKQKIFDFSSIPSLWYENVQQAKSFFKSASTPINKKPLEDILNNIKNESEKEWIYIFDVGCGNGEKGIFVSKYFINRQFDINLCFLDSSEIMLREARINAHLQGIEAELNKADITDATFFYKTIYREGRSKRLVLFLGQTLGNFNDLKQVFYNLSMLTSMGYLLLEVDLEKDVKRYYKSEDFMYRFIEPLGFKKNELDYLVEEDDKGICASFILKNSACKSDEEYKKGTKFIVGRSMKFNENSLSNLLKTSTFNIVSSMKYNDSFYVLLKGNFG